jgi:hypothetical protein
MIGAVKPVRLISLKVLDVYKFCLSQIMSVYESGISAARTDVSETGNFVLSDILLSGDSASPQDHNWDGVESSHH